MNWHKILKILGILLMVFLVYEIMGALVPFILPISVSDDYINQLDLTKYYHKGETTKDRAYIVESNKEALDIRLQMINSAKERIVYCTFDIRKGESCNDVFSALYDAAERGIQVQILMDGLNGQKEMKAKSEFYGVGTHSNIEIRFYNPFNLLKPWTFNGRMHDKYIIVDDNQLLLGGRNTFDYFIGDYNQKKMSYDREVFIFNENSAEDPTGSSIVQVEEYFNEVWNLKVCKTVYHKYMGSTYKLKKQQEFFKNRWNEIKIDSPKLFDKDIDYNELTTAVDKITLLANPTHIYAKEPIVWYDLYSLMKSARKRVYVFTPYAVFNKVMYQGFLEIGGIVEDFKMQLNSTAVGDNFMASSDYTKNRKHILRTGVELYEFQGTNSSHGKSLLIDDTISVIGSYNFDLRSTYVDTELMLIIEGKEFNQQLEVKIKDMEEQSLKVDSDGSYENNSAVPAVQLPGSKKFIFSITSRLFQLIRYLL